MKRKEARWSSNLVEMGYRIESILLPDYHIPGDKTKHMNIIEMGFQIQYLLLRHSLGSSRKSVHERPRNSDGLQVKWSVLRAIWLKRQDP